MGKHKRKPSLRRGLPVLIIGITMIAVGYVGVGPLQNGRPPSCFPETCSSLAYFAILGLAGLFVALWGALQTILGLIIRPGYLQHESGPLAPPQAGSGPEDENLLSMAKDLQIKIKRPKLGAITSLAWSDHQPWYWPSFKRQAIRKPITILLDADLRTRLDAEDWRILLNYYFQNLKPKSRLMFEFIAPFGFAFLLILLGGVLISSDYSFQASRFYGQFVAAPLVLIDLAVLLLRAKGIALKQDKSTAELVGRQALLSVFKKIDQQQLQRVENAKKRHGLLAQLWPMPNITERIENLTGN